MRSFQTGRSRAVPAARNPKLANPLLPDAEAAEDVTQNIVRRRSADQPFKGFLGSAQILSEELPTEACSRRLLKTLRRGDQRSDVPLAGKERGLRTAEPTRLLQ